MLRLAPPLNTSVLRSALCAPPPPPPNSCRATGQTHAAAVQTDKKKATAACSASDFWTSWLTDRLHPTSAGHVCFSSAAQKLFLLYNLDDCMFFFFSESGTFMLRHLHRVTIGCRTWNLIFTFVCSLSSISIHKKYQQSTVNIKVRRVYFPQSSLFHMLVAPHLPHKCCTERRESPPPSTSEETLSVHAV